MAFPVAAAAGIGAGVGAAASGIASLFSQADTNKANLRIARETNAQNKELFERNLAWQEDMWNKTNAYNDPSNQVELLLRAGINPAAVYGNGSMPTASQLSAPSTPQMQGATMQPLDFSGLGNAVSNGINTYAAVKMNDAQTKATYAQADKTQNEALKLSQEMPYYTRLLENQVKEGGWRAGIAQTELAYLQAVNGQRISRAFGDNRLLERQIKQADEQYIGYKLQNDLARVQLAYAPKMNEAQLSQYYSTVAQLKAEVQLTLARADLTTQQKLNVIEERAGIILENGMKSVDFHVKQETKDVTIGVAREELYKMEDERRMRPFQYNYQFTGKVGQYFNMPSGQFGAASLFETNQKRDRFKK